MNVKKECELKLKLESINDELRIMEKLNSLDYFIESEKLETDFIIDTVNHELKNRKILFRVRNINIDDKFLIVFTVKIKGDSKDFQDNLEIETYSNDIIVENIEKMIKILTKQTNKFIDSNIFYMSDIENILEILHSNGYILTEIMQKKRLEYKGAFSNVCVDNFPNNIGTFLEIEANCEENLYKTIDLLKINEKNLEKRNYGKIIRNVMKDNKICIFNDYLLIDEKEKKWLPIRKLKKYLIK